MIDKIN